MYQKFILRINSQGHSAYFRQVPFQLEFCASAMDFCCNVASVPMKMTVMCLHCSLNYNKDIKKMNVNL